MQAKHTNTARSAQEPIGIVIADGGSPTVPTRFSAYVWGPVPDEETPVVSGHTDEHLVLASA